MTTSGHPRHASTTAEATTAAYPTCERCEHEWHGLRCATPVLTIARGGRRTDPCGCRHHDVDAA